MSYLRTIHDKTSSLSMYSQHHIRIHVLTTHRTTYIALLKLSVHAGVYGGDDRLMQLRTPIAAKCRTGITSIWSGNFFIRHFAVKIRFLLLLV